MASWKKSKRNLRLWLPLCAAIGLGFVAALTLAKIFSQGSKIPAVRSTLRDPIPLQAATIRKVHLYFASRNGRYLQAEERRVEARDTTSAIEAIVEALLEGPEDSRLLSAIPAGTRLLHLFVTDDGTAYVNFNRELSDSHPGGVSAEQLTLYAIVNSIVLNLDSIERVQLLLEGKPAPTLNGHLDVRHAKTANLLIVR